MQRGTLLALSFVLAACGARTPLSIGGTSTTGSGGSGSTSGTGTGTGTGTAGAGGAVSDLCSVMTLAGPPIGTLPDPQYDQVNPALAISAEGDAIPLFGRRPVESDGDVTSPIADAMPVPWDGWPQGLGEIKFPVSNGGEAFQAATSTQGGLAFFLDSTFPPSSQGLYIIPSASPWMTSPDLGTKVVDTSATPLFLVRGGGQHFAGANLLQTDGTSRLALMVVDPGATVSVSISSSGCANDVLSAAGVPVGDGLLAATSSSRPLDQCSDDGPFGPPTRVQVVHWSSDGSTAPGADMDILDTVAQVALVRRSDGAWLVWQGTGANAEFPPPIQAVRVDPNGMLAGPMISVTPDGATTGPFAAAAIDDRLAVAWPDRNEPGAPVIAVSVLAANGDKLPGAGISTAMAPLAHGRIAALGSPWGEKLLVAWSGLPDTVGGPQRFQVVRFDCAMP